VEAPTAPPRRPAGLVDTHVHLEELGPVAHVVEESIAAGVTRLVAMGVDVQTSRAAIAAAEEYSEVFAAVGHHPVNSAPPDMQELAELARQPRVIAVGEVGLDRAHPDRAPDRLQEEWLEGFLALGIENDLPVSLHTRDSEADLHRLLSSHPRASGVMHYFSLDWAWAERFLRLGFHLSFSGLVTRPSRQALREVVRRCPADRLLLESDAPYGTPHGHRAPNRPAWLAETAAVVAGLREISLEELSALEFENARRLFRRMH
jgi:TatD DNase family protein